MCKHSSGQLAVCIFTDNRWMTVAGRCKDTSDVVNSSFANAFARMGGRRIIGINVCKCLNVYLHRFRSIRGPFVRRRFTRVESVCIMRRVASLYMKPENRIYVECSLRPRAHSHIQVRSCITNSMTPLHSPKYEHKYAK